VPSSGQAVQPMPESPFRLCDEVGYSLYLAAGFSLYPGVGYSLYPGVGFSLYPAVGFSLYPEGRHGQYQGFIFSSNSLGFFFALARKQKKPDRPSATGISDCFYIVISLVNNQLDKPLLNHPMAIIFSSGIL